MNSVGKNPEKTKQQRLEDALLEYIERVTKETSPVSAANVAIVPAMAEALIKLWGL